MQSSWCILGLACGLSAACSGAITRFTASETAPVAEATFRATARPTADITADAPLRIERALGDDAWSFATPVTRGARHGDAVIAWSWNTVLVIDEASGQPRTVLPVAQATTGDRMVTAAATDGVQVAALLADGSAVYWSRVDAAPIAYAPPPPRERERTEVAALVRSPVRGIARLARDADMDRTGELGRNEVLGHWRDDARHRIAFSPDGARLVAGAQIYAVADGRALLDLAHGDVVVDADSHGAVVVTVMVEQVPRDSSGDQVGGVVPTAVVVALAWRPIDGPAVPYPGALGLGPVRASAAEGWVGFPSNAPVGAILVHDLATGARRGVVPAAAPPAAPTTPTVPAITAIDIADDGTLVLARHGGGFVVRGSSVKPLALPRALGDGPRVNALALAGGVTYALAEGRRGDGESRTWLVEIAAAGSGRARPIEPTGRVSRDGRVIVHTGRRVWARGLDGDDRDLGGSRPRLSGLGLPVRDRIVLRDRGDAEDLFVVLDRERPPRTIRIAGDATAWDVAADGSTAAVAGRGRITTVDLDTGAPAITETLDGDVLAIATARAVTAVATADGRVRVWACGRASTIDLRARVDVARALAISPDQRRLAIGTGRGIALVIDVRCRVP